jgi:putative addiction module component (TIGR02574 family)
MDIRKEIKKLSEAEKILLVEDIWDEIDVESKAVLSKKKREDIDKRLEEIRQGKSASHSWEEVKVESKKIRDAI